MTIKEETSVEEPDNIRAQFFADLKRLKTPEAVEADPVIAENHSDKGSSQFIQSHGPQNIPHAHCYPFRL